MNIPTTSLLRFSRSTAQTYQLRHELVDTDSSQRRLVDRVALVPSVALASYRFRSVIDWIEFRVQFGRRTQAHHVQQVLRRHLDRDSYIAPKDPGEGKTFSICSIRIQEPSSLALIAKIHHDLVRTFGETASSCVEAIEVSVDAYPRQPSDEARATLLSALQRTIWTGLDIWSNPNSRPRTFGSNNQFEKLVPPPREEAPKKRLNHRDELPSALVPTHHHAPFADGTMYLGSKYDDAMIRIMDKVKDKQRPDGTFQALPDDRKRVRIEVALKGIQLLALGISDVPSLRRAKITAIKKRYFQFRLPTFSWRAPISTAAEVMQNTRQLWRAQAYLRSGTVGLMAMDAASEEYRKTLIPSLRKTLRSVKRSKGRTWIGKRLAAAFISWSGLNRKVDAALQQLGKREKTAWRER